MTQILNGMIRILPLEQLKVQKYFNDEAFHAEVFLLEFEVAEILAKRDGDLLPFSPSSRTQKQTGK